MALSPQILFPVRASRSSNKILHFLAEMVKFFSRGEHASRVVRPVKPPETAWLSRSRNIFVTIVAIGHLPLAASVGAECAEFSARCLRRVHGTALPQALLRARDVWDACTALESRDWQ